MDNTMMDSDIYSRQEPLHLSVPHHVLVAGVGGVGSWVAVLLALSGVKKLSLFDMDTVELSNLNRTLFTSEDIAHNKAIAMRQKILQLRPEAIVLAYPVQALPGMLTSNYNALVDCTDDFQIQRELFLACSSIGIEYVRAGYNGLDHFTVSSSIPGWHTESEENQHDESNERYSFTPSWAAPAMLTAVLAVAKLLKYKDMEVTGECFNILANHLASSVSRQATG